MKRLMIIISFIIIGVSCGYNDGGNSGSFPTTTGPRIGNPIHKYTLIDSQPREEETIGKIEIEVSINFEDIDGDIATLKITIKDRDNNLHIEEKDLRQEYQGKRQGIIKHSFTASIPITGRPYILEIVVIDQQGQTSNKFTPILEIELTNVGAGSNVNVDSDRTSETDNQVNRLPQK